MQTSRRLSLWTGLVAVALILLAQFMSWRESGRPNAALLVMLALVLGSLFTTLRRRPPDDPGSPRR